MEVKSGSIEFKGGFQPKSDKDLRENIRRYYYHCLQMDDPHPSSLIKLGNAKWYSANALNLVLIFIESIRINKPNCEIRIELFQRNLIASIRNSEEKDGKLIEGEIELNEIEVQEIKNKLIFFEVIGFSKEISEYETKGVALYPGSMVLEELQALLSAIPFQEEYAKQWKYSSRILGLSRIIETELEQRKLSDEVSTMVAILRENLRGRTIGYDAESGKEIRHDSHQALHEGQQITFELVKNIYQHAEISQQSTFSSSGYICAQFVRHPPLDKPEPKMQPLFDLLKVYENRSKKGLQYLCITINDFGIGLVNKIRMELRNDLNERSSFRKGRFDIDSIFLDDDAKLILLAVTTDYTSKKLDKPSTVKKSDLNDEKFLEHKLASKGLGFLFCMGFIARYYGRMEIRSGKAKVLIMAELNAMFAEFWKNTKRIAEVLDQEFDKYFKTIFFDLSEDEGVFPGTQIIIQIPIVRSWPR